MRKIFCHLPGLVIALLLTGPLTRALAAPTSGLWVGEVTLQRVNETVDGVTADKQIHSPDPAVTTPVTSPAHLRIIFHVDANGQVRLLKGVAIVNRSTNNAPDLSGTNIALISDPALYQGYGNTSGSRITAVAYDFGDTNGTSALNQIAAAAANAAVSGTDSLTAANQAQQSLSRNPPANTSLAYSNFLQSSDFSRSAALAAAAASNSLVGSSYLLTPAKKFLIANGAAVKALLEANIYTTADALILNEVAMTGQITPNSILSGTIYLGADHPTNPFRHKWNPIHQHGYAITRAVKVTFDSVTSSNAVNVVGFGVDRITGTYREEIFGLHKPLGPNQDVGLITEGTIKLDRISLVDTLNQ